ncbi:MAG: hypothetical protein XE04_1707 [Marinimicrobia bacterium 46_43]|nr:MAG: hypothetical protein XE04_1707 [Marinimicrobia bacterium 46_43]
MLMINIKTAYKLSKRFMKSGRWDSNPGPLTPHASALAGLRHAPICELYYSRLYSLWQVSIVSSFSSKSPMG